jgi:enoyl-CoA hydratase/carnithine racemase
MPDLFWNIAADHENKVIILTGTGDRFSTECDPDFELSSGDAVAKVHWEGHRILRNLLEVEAPVISAINGPLHMHSFPLLGDITLCSEHTTFQDPHVLNGMAAGDGAQIVWQYLIGPTRGKYFLFTGQIIDAAEALRLGVVNEVLPAANLLPRAWEIARALALRPQTALRYTRLAANAELRRLMSDLPMGYALQTLGTSTTVDREWAEELQRRRSAAKD